MGISTDIITLAENSIDTLTDNINCRIADFLAFNQEKEIFETVFSSGEKVLYFSYNPFFQIYFPLN